jgi:DNA-directed RNA polymerase subunit M/transcription elongation factor TFIIS
MDPKRKCPECGSENYLFRGRKKIPAEAGQGEAMDTKYRCKACEHVWTERVPVKSVEPAP